MSDHISGPRALADPIADITDVYAFPSPDRPGALVLVVNTLPMAKPADSLLRRASLPLPAATAQPAPTAGPGWRFIPGDEEVVLDCVFDAPDAPSNSGDQPPSCAAGQLCDPVRGTRHLPRQRRAGRLGARHAGLRRHALGPVHHGCPRSVGHDRDAEARVHRPRLDLPRWQERAEHRRRDRHRSPGRLDAGGCRRRDADPGDVQRQGRTGGSARGEEHDARARRSSTR